MVTHGVTLFLRPGFIEMSGDEFPSAGLAHVRAISHHLVQVVETRLLRHHHRTHAKHVLARSDEQNRLEQQSSVEFGFELRHFIHEQRHAPRRQ